MNPEDDCCICSDKFRREHTATIDDILFTRRDFLIRTGMGLGALSLASLFGLNPFESAEASEQHALSPLLPRKPHFNAKAKSVIHIFAEGGPSHVDTFDPKPALAQYADKTLPGMD